ncbi:hypothetical protein Bca4012_044926 [Brassica carinata]
MEMVRRCRQGSSCPVMEEALMEDSEMALIYVQYSGRIGGEFLHDEEKHQLVMIMPTPSSPTRSCFFRDHLVSPRQWLLSRYDRILELMRFNDGQQACALLGTGHVFESSTARSLFLASSSDSNSEKREENRGTYDGP